ncbi:protein IWS1 homolog [Anopheles moucheti]|uniref:protein IWS1 homolog n=1 Tax=Anopheles moucheti TaxID=186751 RepID=UPI0022F05E5A|nr:protein IWS1 homolog [Anopheles moucheti]
MKINKKGKSRRKRSKAAASGSQNVTTKSIETRRLRRESRTLDSSQKNNASEQNHNEPNLIETESQTVDCKQRSQPSNLAKIRNCYILLIRSMSGISITSDSGNNIQKPKQIEGSSDEKKVNSQTDLKASGGSVKNIKKKRGANLVHGDGQGSLKDHPTCAKPGASGSGKYVRHRKDSQTTTIKLLEKQRLRRSRKGSTSKPTHNEPNVIKAKTQTAHSKKRTHRSSLVKVHKKSSMIRSKSAKMQATDGGKNILQGKRMADSNNDEEVNTQPDLEVAGDFVRNIKKKRQGKIVHKDDQDVLNDDSSPVTSIAVCAGKSIQKRKRTDGSSGNEEVSIEEKSSGNFAKYVKMKRRTNEENGDDQDVPNDISKSAKPGASDSGNYIRHRKGKRGDDARNDEEVNMQPELDALNVSATNIKKEKKKRGRNAGHGDDQDILNEDYMIVGSGKCVKQRKRSDNLTHQEKFSIQIDSNPSGDSKENVKEPKKIGQKMLYVLVQDVLANGFTSMKLSATGGGKCIQQRKQSADSSDVGKVSIHTDSYPVDGSAKNVQKENNGIGGTVISGDHQNVYNDGSTFENSGDSNSGKYIRQRTRKNDSDNEKEVNSQAGLDLSSSFVKIIKKEKKNREENMVLSGEQCILDDGFTSTKPSASDAGKYTKQRKRKRSCDPSNEEKICIQTVSDSTGGTAKNIKKKKSGYVVHGDNKGILEDRSLHASDSAADSGEHIQQRNLNDNPIDEEEIIMQLQNMQKKNEEINTQNDNLNILRNGSKSRPFLSDFDFMRARKKAENSHRRKRNHDCDTYEGEAMIELLDQMKQAAIQDRQLNLDGKPATKKIAILHKVMKQLINKNLQPTLLSHNVLHVLAEWISPLPNKALPCLQIRESILKLLADFPSIDKLYLKESGIGKAVMYLYKHPKEIKANRARANVLISGWFRSVFNISTDFNGMSLDERRQHDMRQLPKNFKPSTQDAVPSKPVVRPDFWLFNAHKNTIRPGEKGWISRARVPMPSDKVYIMRPKSKIETSLISSVTKKQPNRYEMYLKKFNNYKRKSTTRSPVQLAITEGTKMCDY